jgi:hypothetical protein
MRPLAQGGEGPKNQGFASGGLLFSRQKDRRIYDLIKK